MPDIIKCKKSSSESTLSILSTNSKQKKHFQFASLKKMKVKYHITQMDHHSGKKSSIFHQIVIPSSLVKYHHFNHFLPSIRIKHSMSPIISTSLSIELQSLDEESHFISQKYTITSTIDHSRKKSFLLSRSIPLKKVKFYIASLWLSLAEWLIKKNYKIMNKN